MSIFYEQNGALIASGKRLTTTAETTVYTALKTALPALDSINLCNASGSPVSVTVRWWKANVASSFAVVFAKPIAANDRLIIADLPISMLEGDEIRVTATTANVVDVIVVAIENRGAGK